MWPGTLMALLAQLPLCCEWVERPRQAIPAFLGVGAGMDGKGDRNQGARSRALPAAFRRTQAGLGLWPPWVRPQVCSCLAL